MPGEEQRQRRSSLGVLTGLWFDCFYSTRGFVHACQASALVLSYTLGLTSLLKGS